MVLAWEKKYPITGRAQEMVTQEFMLLLQYMIMNRVPSPLAPSREWIERWLRPAEGLDVYGIRLSILKRLSEMQGQPYPEYLPFPPTTLLYPDANHLFLWRQYARKLYQRSRETIAQITTDRIVQLEKDTWPYYEMQKLVMPIDMQKGMMNVHLESHLEVVEILARSLPPKHDGRYRILEFGCGDGRLLLAMRQRFANADFLATNLFQTNGVLDPVKCDPKIEILTYNVEDFPLELGKFDAVISTEVIEHLLRPEVMVEKTRELLLEGGVFIITAPSLHVQFLSKNPLTYLFGLLSVIFEWVLPPFHNLWQPLTDLHIIHHAFSYSHYKRMFLKHFPNTVIAPTRFTHLKKFHLEKLASKIPILRRWGGLMLAYGTKKHLLLKMGS